MNLQSKIQEARNNGYSNSEILDHLSSDENFSSKIQEARSTDYGDDEIIDFLSTQESTPTKQQTSVKDIAGKVPDAINNSIFKHGILGAAINPRKVLDQANQAAAGVMGGAVGLVNLPAQAVRMGGEALGVPANYLPLSTAEINQRNIDSGFTPPQSQDFGMRAARFMGEIAAPASIFRKAASIPEAIAQSSVISAAQPARNPDEFSKNIGIGMGTGAVLSSLLRPAMRPDVQKLMSEGITPTPGQLYGGMAQRAEEALTSVPLVGDIVRSGQRRAIGQLNTAVINRSLKPIGEKLPSSIKSGREAVDQAETILSTKYDVLLPKISAKLDKQLVDDLRGVLDITKNLSDDTEKQLRKIIDNEIISKFQKNNGQIDGKVYKSIESELGEIARGYRHNDSYDIRQLSFALDAARESMRNLLSRSNPAQKAELAKINKGWANLKRVKLAASSDRAGEMFSPAQLQAAVRRADSTKDKGAFATRKALMQDLSDPAFRVLGSKVPDSGTPLRTMAAMGAAGGAAYISPYALLAAPLLAGYLPVTQKIIAKGLTSKAGLRTAPLLAGNIPEY